MNDRDQHLLALMDAAIPRVTDSGDWHAVIEQAASRPRAAGLWRRLAPVIAVGALIAVLVTLLVIRSDEPEITPAAPSTTGIEEGARLARDSNCLSCHAIGGEGASGPGPDLSQESSKARGVQWQIDHLRDPPSKVPGSAMPAYPGFSDNEIRLLAAYLEGLGANSEPASPVPPIGTESSPIAPQPRTTSSAPASPTVPVSIIAVLGRPATDADRVSGAVPTSPDWPQDPNSTRLAFSDSATRIWVGATTNGGVCISIDGRWSKEQHCEPIADFADRGVMVGGQGGNGVSFEWGLVRDDVTSVRNGDVTRPVRNNVYWLDAPDTTRPVQVFRDGEWVVVR